MRGREDPKNTIFDVKLKKDTIYVQLFAEIYACMGPELYPLSIFFVHVMKYPKTRASAAYKVVEISAKGLGSIIIDFRVLGLVEPMQD